MFDPRELETTIALHRKTYELLRWIAKNLRGGRLDFTVVHRAMSAADAAREWLARHRENLPMELRPRQEMLDPFARLFSSYLTTSFELRESPGMKVATYCGCFCSWCAYLTSADHLQARRVTKHAQRNGEALARVYLQSLTDELEVQQPHEKIDRLLADAATTEPLAMAAYARELIRRTQFASQGLGVLALWRKFAWRNGSPRRNFELKADDVLMAEKRLVDALAAE